MSPNPRSNAVLALLVAGVLTATGAWAKSSDRNQPMDITSGAQDGNFGDNATTKMWGGVEIKQGTLEIEADQGEIYSKDGQISRAVFTGKQAHMKQINDDGTPIDAVADRIDYDVLNDVVTLTGNYKVTSPKGSNAGQKMVYNTKTGNMQSGGDGTRVHTVIQPKTKAPGATVGSPTPAQPAKPGAK
ncbi:lipopolysaccharide export system protein LptA [Pseudoxanthomonas sp. GM95]|uniref:lipopolysaccharide transport periplasmic protein LptA n=1 Tax=Pseudoxanthomonas sp. GM95 TaxID=1881043 RepID=UPI0008D8ABCE|nr:lipopolysaccharide transport periplasmic protein LptA [Pseudoxanthomonas sp. GM95]SEL76042.1 lipopolysaccharide export system protein LptA [Pseudoxanthomonas sp. GM95]